jgi:hypothetical protein
MSAALLSWTELPDKYGTTMTAKRGTWPELVDRIRTVGAFPNKDSCPWVKLATFGDERSPVRYENGKKKGDSLRWDKNLQTVYGIEGDYDSEKVTMEQALVMLERHGIRAAIYPSPSNATVNPPHSQGGPRWRVIAPLARQHPPGARATLVARLNGALGGILAGESFTLSQGYFFGATPANQYRVVSTFGDPNDGTCVDDLDDLDSIAIGKGSAAKPTKPTEGVFPNMDAPYQPKGENLFADRVEQMGRLLVEGDGRRELLKSYIASRSARGLSPDELRALIAGVVDKYFAEPIDDANIEAIIKWATGRDANKNQDIGDLFKNAQAANEPRYKLLTGDDLDALPPIPWRVRGVYPATGLAAMFGPSKSGKSFLCFDAACNIADGADWFGYRTEAADVVMVCLEGESGYKLRSQAWQKHYGKRLPERLRLVMQPFRLTDPQDIADLAAVVPPGAVVFVDTMNRAAPTADENSSRDMGEIIEGAKALQRLTQGLVILVAHTGKDTSKGLRGHSSLLAALDGAIEVSRDGDRRKWSVDKAKDGIDGAEHPFRLEVLELGQDEYGETLTSCAVSLEGIDALHQYVKPMTARQSEVMQAFWRAAPVAGLLNAEGDFAGLHRESWRGEFYKSCAADSQAAKQKAFVRAIQDLTNLGHVSVVDDVFRLDGITAGFEETQFSKALRHARYDPDTRTEPGQNPDLSALDTPTYPDRHGHDSLGVSECPGVSEQKRQRKPKRKQAKTLRQRN